MKMFILILITILTTNVVNAQEVNTELADLNIIRVYIDGDKLFVDAEIDLCNGLTATPEANCKTPGSEGLCDIFLSTSVPSEKRYCVESGPVFRTFEVDLKSLTKKDNIRAFSFSTWDKSGLFTVGLN